MTNKEHYQINSAIGVCGGRIENGGDLKECFDWLYEEIGQIKDGVGLYSEEFITDLLDEMVIDTDDMISGKFDAVKKFTECTDDEKEYFEHLRVKKLDTYPRDVYKTVNDFLMVMTPNPYLIYSGNYSGDKLDTHVRGLYRILKMLDISIEEARTNDYSLNLMTGDRLWTIYYQKRGNLSKEDKDFFNSFKW